MLGQVGDDGFGKDYFEALGKEGIDAEGVRIILVLPFISYGVLTFGLCRSENSKERRPE